MARQVYCSSVKLLCFLSFLSVTSGNVRKFSESVIDSVSVLDYNDSNKNDTAAFTEIPVQIRGSDLGAVSVKPTAILTRRGDVCISDFNDDLAVQPVWSNRTVAIINIRIPSQVRLQPKPLYLCVMSVRTNWPATVQWIHQGKSVVFQLAGSQLNEKQNSVDSHLFLPRRRRAAEINDDYFPSTSPSSRNRKISGIRLETTSSPWHMDDDGVLNLLSGSSADIRVFGERLSSKTRLALSKQSGSCEFLVGTTTFSLKEGTGKTGIFSISLPDGELPGTEYFLCLSEETPLASPGSTPLLPTWENQGYEPWLKIRSFTRLFPVWVSILIVLTCLLFSALFSGLNLGLMSLDMTDLKIICNTGTPKEQRCARAILPVRKHGNFLLCSILLGNVLVNSTLTIIMDDLTSGLVAVIGSTLAIVIFGEITPQAVCSRHGLTVGAMTIHITKVVMGLTSPLSYPISKILDVMLGEEIGNVYTRERIKELVKVTTEFNDLEKDEVNIIAGALELRKKTVAEVMTKLEDVYMLPIDSILDFETVSEIMKSGFSRVPVYEGKRTNVTSMLYTKDLAFVDPDDNTPLKTLIQFYQNECNFVFEDTTLDVMFKYFKDGIKGHMALVHRVNNEGEGDPFYETIGLITLEDVIEELIQAEIMDETDVFTDNRSKKRRIQNSAKVTDFTVFCERRENQRIYISPQLTLATFQYLSTSVDAFKPENISETILGRLLKHDVIYHIKVKNKEKARQDPSTIIYQQGKPADYFVLILEGRVEVTVGRENLLFESGPFTYFGTQALTQNVNVAESPTAPQNMGSAQSVNLDVMLRHTFVPDYTVRAIMEVFYVRIKRSAYLAAKQATLMAKSRKDSTDERFDDEVEKLLHSLDEDDVSQSRGEADSSPMQQTPALQSKPSLSGDNRGGERPPTQAQLRERFMSAPIVKTHMDTSPNGSAFLAVSPSSEEEPSLVKKGEGTKEELATLLSQTNESC